VNKRIDVAALPAMVGTLYPPPFDMPCRARERTKLGDPAGSPSRPRATPDKD
jgi:hypothetical protein